MKNKNINQKLLLGTLLVGGVATITMASETVHAEENNTETLNESAKKTLNKVNLAGSLGNTMETVKENQDGLDLAVKPVKPVQTSVKSESNVKVSEKEKTVVGTTKAVSKAPAKKEEVKVSKVDSLIASGNNLKGIKYVWGGTTTKGFDCSGFVQYIFKENGLSLPRTSAAMSTVGTKVSGKSNLQAGDLVFFATGDTKGKVTHVGMYIGNNKFIHASTSKGVSVSDINDPYYWGNKFLHGQRISGVN